MDSTHARWASQAIPDRESRRGHRSALRPAPPGPSRRSARQAIRDHVTRDAIEAPTRKTAMLRRVQPGHDNDGCLDAFEGLEQSEAQPTPTTTSSVPVGPHPWIATGRRPKNLENRTHRTAGVIAGGRLLPRHPPWTTPPSTPRRFRWVRMRHEARLRDIAQPGDGGGRKKNRDSSVRGPCPRTAPGSTSGRARPPRLGTRIGLKQKHLCFASTKTGARMTPARMTRAAGGSGTRPTDEYPRTGNGAICLTAGLPLTPALSTLGCAPCAAPRPVCRVSLNGGTVPPAGRGMGIGYRTTAAVAADTTERRGVNSRPRIFPP